MTDLIKGQSKPIETMHLVDTITDKARMVEKPPFGPGFTAKQAAAAEAVEVWGSSFNDPGADFNEFRLIVEGTVTERVRINGY